MYINKRQVVAWHLGTTESDIDKQLGIRNWEPFIIIKCGAFLKAIKANSILSDEQYNVSTYLKLLPKELEPAGLLVVVQGKTGKVLVKLNLENHAANELEVLLETKEN